MREALAASQVDHRNVVHVIDFGVTDDGTPYLVMEYLRGRDLGVLLKKAKAPLAIEYVADVMLGVCAALRACHQLGIVHRDLKPSNIFLADTDTGPEIKVLDFGVSKAPMAGDLTQEGQILGTPQYLSPEQVNGKVGPESDQYALGVLLYVCLTKKLPFEEHQNLSLLRAIEIGRFQGPRAHRPEIPEPLEAIVLRAMHANPAERFDSVHALGQALWTVRQLARTGRVEELLLPHAALFHVRRGDAARHSARARPGCSGASVAAGGPGAPATVDPTAMLAPSVNVAPKLSAGGEPAAFPFDEARQTDPRTPRRRLPPMYRLPAAAGGDGGPGLGSPQESSPREWGSGTGTSGAPRSRRRTRRCPSRPKPPFRSSCPRRHRRSHPIDRLTGRSATAPKLPDRRLTVRGPPGPGAGRDRARRRCRRKRTPFDRFMHLRADNPPKLTGLDKNGIGIPSN